MKIVVCSDNHSNLNVIDDIRTKHYDADYFLHLGDSEMTADMLRPFTTVMGNNDFDYSLPYERFIDTGIIKILMCHGHSYSCDLNMLTGAAKLNDCDLVLFGHTHEYLDTTFNGIRVINPGSCRRNRNSLDATYCVINVDDNKQISVEKFVLESK